MYADLEAIRDLVAESSLPTDVRQTVLARLDELPGLYAELGRTYECRYSDRILDSVARVVRVLEAEDAGPDAPGLAATLVERMRAMHDRHGISVALKPRPPVSVKAARKKKAR